MNSTDMSLDSGVVLGQQVSINNYEIIDFDFRTDCRETDGA